LKRFKLYLNFNLFESNSKAADKYFKKYFPILSTLLAQILIAAHPCFFFHFSFRQQLPTHFSIAAHVAQVHSLALSSTSYRVKQSRHWPA
jgi:hypothetical protein